MAEGLVYYALSFHGEGTYRSNAPLTVGGSFFSFFALYKKERKAGREAVKRTHLIDSTQPSSAL